MKQESFATSANPGLSVQPSQCRKGTALQGNATPATKVGAILDLVSNPNLNHASYHWPPVFVTGVVEVQAICFLVVTCDHVPSKITGRKSVATEVGLVVRLSKNGRQKMAERILASDDGDWN